VKNKGDSGKNIQVVKKNRDSEKYIVKKNPDIMKRNIDSGKQYRDSGKNV